MTMTQQEYDKQKCWIDLALDAANIDKVTVDKYKRIFNSVFDKAYTLGKQEKDAEGEEMLTVPRSKVMKEHAEARSKMDNTWWQGYMIALQELFGFKCLPDEDVHEVNFTNKEPKFKVRDKVRIKSNAAEYHQGYQNGYAWLPNRDVFVGKPTFITAIHQSGSI